MLERETQSIGAPGARLGLLLRPQPWDVFNWVLDCMGRIRTKSTSPAAPHPALGLPHFQTFDAHAFWSIFSWSPRHTSTDDWRNPGWDWQHTLQTKVFDRHILISRWYHFECVDCSNASRTLGVGAKKPVRKWPLCIVSWCPRKHAWRVAKNADWVRAGSEQATLCKTCHEALWRIALEATINYKIAKRKKYSPRGKRKSPCCCQTFLQAMKQEMSLKFWRNLRHRVHRQKRDHRFAILQLHLWYLLMPFIELEPKAIDISKTSTYRGWRWRSCCGCSSTQDLRAGQQGVFLCAWHCLI